MRHLHTREITIRCDKSTPINLDGETRMAQVAHMALAEEKIRFFYPRGLTYAPKETANV